MIITCPSCFEEFDNHADAWEHANEEHPSERREVILDMTKQNFPHTVERRAARPRPEHYQKKNPDVAFSVVPMGDGRSIWCFMDRTDLEFFCHHHADIQ